MNLRFCRKFTLLFGMLEEIKRCAEWKTDTRRMKSSVYRLIERRRRRRRRRRRWRRRRRRRFCRPTRCANPLHRIKSGENNYGSNWVPSFNNGSDIKIICPGLSIFSIVKITRAEFRSREIRNLMLAWENTQLQFVNMLKLSIVFLPIISSEGKWI